MTWSLTGCQRCRPTVVDEFAQRTRGHASPFTSSTTSRLRLAVFEIPVLRRSAQPELASSGNDIDTTFSRSQRPRRPAALVGGQHDPGIDEHVHEPRLVAVVGRPVGEPQLGDARPVTGPPYWSKDCQPEYRARLTVDEHARRPVEHPADRPPPGGIAPANAATRAWSSPPPSTHDHGSAPTASAAPPTARDRPSAPRCTRRGSRRTPRPRAAGRRPSRPRRRSSPERRPRRPLGPVRRAAAGPDGVARSSSNPPVPLLPQRISGAEWPSWPATASCEPGRAPDRSTGARPARSPSTVTDTTHCGLADQVAADDAAPTRSASSHIPSASARTCCGGRVGGRAETDHERGGPCAHRLDVGGVLRDGLTADLLRASTSPAGNACPSTSMSVETTTRPSASHNHRGVVARSERRRGAAAGARRPAGRSCANSPSSTQRGRLSAPSACRTAGRPV